MCLMRTGSRRRAEVTRVDIAPARRISATSGYEKIVGTIHFAVDPKRSAQSPASSISTRRRRNAAGRVEFSSDLYILRPKAPRGNGAALVDILNRGNKMVLNGFNRGGSPDPATENDLGDEFLMRFGFTIVWVGWEFDVEDRPMAMKIHVPVAAEHGKPITGIVRATFTASARRPTFTVDDLAKYDAVDPTGADSHAHRASGDAGGGAQPVPRAEWHVNGHTVTLDTGFEPGTTYESRYRAANPPVAGLGFVAVRDTTSWLKHQPDALAPVRYAYGFGSSQSGRFLRGFLYEGFNTDEHDRQVFDGVIAHIAGASRLSLNERWAKPTGLGVYNATAFPFADAQPARSGERHAGRAARQRAHGAARAEGVLHQHAGRVLGHRPGRGARAHHSGRRDGSSAARERPRLFHRRHAAFAEPFSGRRSRTASSRQPGRLLVDDARAVAGDAQVGEGGRGAAAEPLSEAAGSDARSGRGESPFRRFRASPRRGPDGGRRIANPLPQGRGRRGCAAAASRAAGR